MYSTCMCLPRPTTDLLRFKSNCSSKCSGISPLCHSSPQQHDRPFSRSACQAVVQQQADVQQLVSVQAQLVRSAAPAAGACSCRAGMTVRGAGKPRSKAGALSATAAAGMTADGSAACTGMPSSPPMGPQRAATQRASGSSAGAPPQAAVATVAVPYVASQQEQRQHHVVQQEVVACQAHVWLPDQQLWLPSPASCVTSSSTPLSSRPGSSGSSLARVFMGSSAVSKFRASMPTACCRLRVAGALCWTWAEHLLAAAQIVHLGVSTTHLWLSPCDLTMPCVGRAVLPADCWSQAQDGGQARAGSPAPRARSGRRPGSSGAPAGCVTGSCV